MKRYRLDRGVALVTVGVCLVVSAVAVFAAFVLVPREGPARAIGIVCAVVAAALLLVAVRFAVRPPVVLRLDATGYRSRTRSAQGRFSGRWLDVEDVTISDGVLCLRTTDAREQRLPLGLVGRSRLTLLRDVHEFLNTAHGYRRFR